jgi:hypothetical protein
MSATHAVFVGLILAASCVWPADSRRPVAPWPPAPGPLRVIIDTDAAAEVDDQYALALALGSPERLRIEGLIARISATRAALPA